MGQTMFINIYFPSASSLCYAFSALTLLVSRQAEQPVTCKNFCPLILQCFGTVGWVTGKASHHKKTCFNIPYYQGETG